MNSKKILLVLPFLLWLLSPIYILHYGVDDKNFFKAWKFVGLSIVLFLNLNFIFGFKFNKDNAPLDKFQNRFSNIDSFKFIFTLIVIIGHIPCLKNNFASTGFCVDYFFLISGFLFCHTYKKDLSISKFVEKKLKFYIPIILYFNLVNVLFEKHINLTNLLLECFLLLRTGFTTTHGGGYCPVSWYISVYFWVLLFYFCLIKYNDIDKSRFYIGIIVFFSYIACIQHKFGLREYVSKEGIGSLLSIALLRGFAGIGLGYLLYSIVKIKEEVFNFYIKQHKNIFTIFELICFCYAVGSVLYKKWQPNNSIVQVINFIFVLFFLYFKEGFFSKLLNKKIFTKLGNASLYIYLGQWTIVKYCYSMFKTQLETMNPYLCFLIIMVICCAWGGYGYVFFKWIRQRKY